jgi:hypothetical protein
LIGSEDVVEKQEFIDIAHQALRKNVGIIHIILKDASEGDLLGIDPRSDSILRSG